MDENFRVTAVALRDMGLRDAEDEEIFTAAKGAAVVVMTKDADFLNLLDRFGTPPQVIWVTCGNTSNAKQGDSFRNLAGRAKPIGIWRTANRNQ